MTGLTDSTYDEYVDEARELLKQQEQISDRLQSLAHEWAGWGLVAEHGDLIELAEWLNRPTDKPPAQ